MDNLGGDAKQQNSPAEIYANIRDKALEEAAVACARLEGTIDYTDMDEYGMIEKCAQAIRALKVQK